MYFEKGRSAQSWGILQGGYGPGVGKPGLTWGGGDRRGHWLDNKIQKAYQDANRPTPVRLVRRVPKSVVSKTPSARRAGSMVAVDPDPVNL